MSPVRLGMLVIGWLGECDKEVARVRPANLDREDVETKALDLIQRWVLPMPPVNVYAIASRLGIRVVAVAFKSDEHLAGMIQKTGAAGTVWVNRFDAHVRQRFTVAHEIGHWLLHMTGNEAFREPDNLVAYRADRGALGLAEVEANWFAAALLMPQPLVNQYLEKKVTDAERLSNIFDVSTQAMEIRLEYLRLETDGPVAARA